MRYAVIGFSTFLITNASTANTLSNTFEQEKQLAIQQSQAIPSQIATVNLADIIPDVNQAPDEANEYGDVTQINNDDLEVKARAFQKNDVQAQGVMKSIASHPVFKIDEKSDLVKQSKAIEANAQEIATSHANGDACVVKYVNKTCQMPVRTLQNICTKTPIVSIDEMPIKNSESLSGQIPAQTNTTGTFTVPFDGVIKSFSVTLKSNDVWICHRTYVGTVNGVLISQMQGQCHKYLGDLHFAKNNLSISVKKNTPIAFKISGYTKGKWQWANYQLTMMAIEPKKTAQITWQERCRYV